AARRVVPPERRGALLFNRLLAAMGGGAETDGTAPPADSTARLRAGLPLRDALVAARARSSVAGHVRDRALGLAGRALHLGLPAAGRFGALAADLALLRLRPALHLTLGVARRATRGLLRAALGLLDGALQPLLGRCHCLR